MEKILHVYADEIGDVGPYDERSPIYALSLLFLDDDVDRTKGLLLEGLLPRLQNQGQRIDR